MQNAAEEHNIQARYEGLYGVLLLIIAGLIFFNSGLFTIKKITVVGNQQVPAEDILIAANFYAGKSIFEVDSGQISRNILKNPQIAGVRITRHYPNQIIIRVWERRPYCAILFGERRILVGTDAVVIMTKAADAVDGLPLVTGIHFGKIAIGEKISNPFFLMALEILGQLDPKIQCLVKEIDLENYRLSVVLPNSRRLVMVELGNGDDLDKKIVNLQDIISNNVIKTLTRIDLRIPDAPTVTYSQ